MLLIWMVAAIMVNNHLVMESLQCVVLIIGEQHVIRCIGNWIFRFLHTTVNCWVV
jgi:hypothetical protein